MPARRSPGGPPITDAVKVEFGWLNSCLMTRGGAVECWGYNEFGKLGGASTNLGERYPIPIVDEGASDFTTLSVGACVVIEGAVICWGNNYWGVHGYPAEDVTVPPRQHPDLVRPMTSLAAGSEHVCGLNIYQEVECWGSNAFGALGEYDPPGRPPLVVDLPVESRRVVASEDTSCAEGVDGLWRCWGGGTLAPSPLQYERGGSPDRIRTDYSRWCF